MRKKTNLLIAITFVFLFLSISLQGISQNVTDNDIVKATLHKNYYQIDSSLDSLGVWYKMHFTRNYTVSDEKIYSISDSKGSVKVYVFQLLGSKINTIVINYRHDNREHIEDMLQKFTVPVVFKVGKYSTDAVFE